MISHIYKLYTKPISQSCGSRNVKSCWMLVPACFNFKSSSSTVFATPPNFQSSTMTQAYIRLIVVRKHVNHHITKGQILLPAYIRLMFCKRQLVFFFLACYISSEYFWFENYKPKMKLYIFVFTNVFYNQNNYKN